MTDSYQSDLRRRIEDLAHQCDILTTQLAEVKEALQAKNDRIQQLQLRVEIARSNKAKLELTRRRALAACIVGQQALLGRLERPMTSRTEWHQAVNALAQQPTTELEATLEDLQDDVFGHLMLSDDIDPLTAVLVGFAGRKKKSWDGFG